MTAAFGNFVAKTDDKPKTKDEMKQTIAVIKTMYLYLFSSSSSPTLNPYPVLYWNEPIPSSWPSSRRWTWTRTVTEGLTPMLVSMTSKKAKESMFCPRSSIWTSCANLGPEVLPPSTRKPTKLFWANFILSMILLSFSPLLWDDVTIGGWKQPLVQRLLWNLNLRWTVGKFYWTRARSEYRAF